MALSQNRRYGWRPDVPDPRDLTFKAHRKSPIVRLPPVIDLRPMLPEIWHQGQLGSCTAHALAAAFEFNQVRQKIEHWTPSRLMIYYLERKLEGTIREDNGAQIRTGAKVLAKFGAAPEQLWPYDIDKFAMAPPEGALKTASQSQVLRYARVDQTEQEVCSVLASGYPVVFGFSVFEEFESDECQDTGILKMPSKGSKNYGGHAVLCCGYDLSKRMFLVRNSWGKDWGLGGYFWMPFDYLLDPKLSDDFWVLYSVEDGDEVDGE